MKKKILLFVLAFAMIFTSLVSVAHAEDGDEPEGFVCSCPACTGAEAGLRSDAEITKCQGQQYLNIAPSAKIVDVTSDNKDYEWHFWDGFDHLNPSINKMVDGDWHYGVLSSARQPWWKFSMAFEEENCVDEIVLVLDGWGQGSSSRGKTYTSTYTNLDDRNGTDYTMEVTLYTWDETTSAEVQYGEKLTYTINKSTPVLKIDVDNINLTKISFNYGRNGEWVLNKVIWEIEVWSNQAFHNWTVNENAIITAPTCTTEGVGGYTCNCGATLANATIPALGHKGNGQWTVEPAVPAVEDDPATEDVDETAAAIPEKCYQGCANTGCTEKLDYGTHSYSSECDLTCNKCSKARESSAAHFYLADCQEACNNCGEARETTVAHTYDHACDSQCNMCMTTRETEGHVYTDCADTECDSQNADGTIKCDGARTAPGHTWDNACDNECNACGAANPDYVAGHTYDNCDDTVCNECEFERTALAHIYDDCDDTGCNTCGMTRTAVAHTYDNACDANCNTCNKARTPADHVYDNACDATCNVCNAARTPADHAYDNACDKTCNVCNAERTVADHAWGEWAENEEGYEERTCANCGVKETGDKAGLGGGAIAGIVIGSVAVVGGGGFAAWWFIFKKKAI